MSQQAFVLRISPSGRDRVQEALQSDAIIIGWANAEGLLDPSLTRDQFRAIISDSIYPNETSLRKAGAATGHMWRFVRIMNEGDFVVVPYGPDFYVAEVKGAARFISDKQKEDSAYRRDVTWLNDKHPIPRRYAKAALVSRMKIHGTSASAT